MDTIIREAISQRRLLEFNYDGLRRVVEPYLFGTYRGKLQLLCYQVRGESASGRLPEWRRMNVAEISELEMLTETFRGGRTTKGIGRSPFDLRITHVPARPAPKTIYLVSGVEGKRRLPMAAKLLYNSPWFRAARAYVEQAQAPWFILSTEHGLVSPEARLDPYDKPLSGVFMEARRVWTDQVFRALQPKLSPGDRVVLLTGELLREFLEPQLVKAGYPVEVPLAGLRIGEQLRWFKQRETVPSIGKTYLLPLPGWGPRAAAG